VTERATSGSRVLHLSVRLSVGWPGSWFALSVTVVVVVVAAAAAAVASSFQRECAVDGSRMASISDKTFNTSK